MEWQYLHASKNCYEKLNPNTLTDAELDDFIQEQILEDPMHHSSSKYFFQEIYDNIIPQMPSKNADITTLKFQNFHRKVKESTSS